MLCINLEEREAEWIKNAILDILENNYRGVQPGREEIINAPPEKCNGLSFDEWRTMQVLYRKLVQ